MQDSIFEALYSNNASINSAFDNIEEVLPKNFTFQATLSDVPSLALFEESVGVFLADKLINRWQQASYLHQGAG